MKRMFNVCLFALLLIAGNAYSVPLKGRNFEKAILVIFENTGYAETMKQPFFKKLAKDGANFTRFWAITHPSQPNYIALTSGALNGVTTNDNYDLEVSNIADLLEAKGLTWKAYAEDYPGGCFLGAQKGGYTRKHNPLISYKSIQKDPKRCARIVNAKEFEKDVAAGKLPHFSFYVPNLNNSGHDTNVAYADKWYGKAFSGIVGNTELMKDTVLITTFDESAPGPVNQIYTTIVGPMVRPGNYSDPVSLYSLLALLEDNWELGDLGKEDVRAKRIEGIWH